MLYREKMSVYSEKMKLINVLCGELLNAKEDGTYNYHCS
jgi:hypothetical protein